MGLSPTMKVFGTSLNPYFGDVEETGIMIAIDDIYKAKSERHVGTDTPQVDSYKIKKTGLFDPVFFMQLVILVLT